MYSFSYLEPVCCSMSSSNCCFLICIQISQEAGQVVWYSHLFENFPQFLVIHIVKGFGIVNKAEIDVFLELSCFFDDLNQISYDYTVEVRNRFKGLDLIDRVPDELWTKVCDIVQETGSKTIPKKKKCKKAKWQSGEALQIAVKRREVKSKGEKERYSHLFKNSPQFVVIHTVKGFGMHSQ